MTKDRAEPTLVSSAAKPAHAGKGGKGFHRKNQGTAKHHMSRKAVSITLDKVINMSDLQAIDFMVKTRFGAWDYVRCPHCGTLHSHYWRAREKRWKCAGCGKPFSITSGTLFHGRKLPLRIIAAAVLVWTNGVAGIAALEQKRTWGLAYNTVYVLQQRIREGLVRGYNVGLISGDIEMDGAHQSGRNAAEKRGRPQGSASAQLTSDTPREVLEATMLTGTAQVKARQQGNKRGARDPEFGKALPMTRRIVLTIRQRSGQRGVGAVRSRVAIGRVEDAPVVEAVMRDFIAIPESTLNTDTSPAYTALGKRFMGHRTVEHSRTLIGPAGENNNQSEELNFRIDRAEKGVYLRLQPKHMLEYACEAAFKADMRKKPNGEQLTTALNIAMSVGRSHWWTGYTHGRHRNEELLHPEWQPAPASGPPKGRHPISSRNGRPPR